MRALLQGPWGAGGRLLPLMALASVAAVGAALVSQHVFDMQPCPWCVLQRLIFLAIAVASLLAWAVPGQAGRRASSALALVLAACGAAAAAWQHFVAASSTSCRLTLADRVVGATGLDQRWPEVFAPYASCADVAVTLLGVPYEFWSAALYVALAAMALQALRRPR